MSPAPYIISASRGIAAREVEGTMFRGMSYGYLWWIIHPEVLMRLSYMIVFSFASISPRNYPDRPVVHDRGKVISALGFSVLPDHV